MKKRILWILLCLSLNSLADDPFDKTQRQQYKSQPVESKESLVIPKCKGERHGIAQDIPFNRLKIIGIVQHKDYKQLLLNDDKKRIFSAVMGDLIAQERLHLLGINKQDIQFSRFQQDCSPGEIVTVRF